MIGANRSLPDYKRPKPGMIVRSAAGCGARHPTPFIAHMPIVPPFCRRASLPLILASALATLSLFACDNPPTANHPLAHLYVGTIYTGHRLPTPVCPFESMDPMVIDSWTVVTHGSDSAIVTTVYSNPALDGTAQRVTRFRYTVRGDTMIVLDDAGRENGVFGTLTASGIDGRLEQAACLVEGAGGVESRFFYPTIHFARRY